MRGAGDASSHDTVGAFRVASRSGAEATLVIEPRCGRGPTGWCLRRFFGPPREPDRLLEVDELDRPEVVEAVDARADGGAARRVAYGGGEPRV